MQMNHLLEVIFKAMVRPQSLGITWISGIDKKRFTPLLIKLVKALAKIAASKEVYSILDKVSLHHAHPIAALSLAIPDPLEA
jgi:hypothetical protein